MTSTDNWKILVLPALLDAVYEELGAKGLEAEQARHFVQAMNRLAIGGIKANGVKKLEALDLYQIRCGRDRVFFIPVDDKGKVIAVGARVTKTKRLLKRRVYEDIEAEVHEWARRVKQGARNE